MGQHPGGAHVASSCKTMLQSKLLINVDILEVYPQLDVVQKSLVVYSSPKLTNNDWIRE